MLRPGAELEGLAAAAECRAFSDWLIGMNATRALTKRLKSRREKTAWSAGRVQTPTLALLVEREARGAGPRAAAVLAGQRHASSATGTTYERGLVRPRVRGRGRRRAPRRPPLRRGACARDRRRRRRPGRRRARDAQALARGRAAALRPDEPPARGEPALLAGRRAARSRRRSAATRATSSSPTRAPTRAAYRTTTARSWTTCCGLAGRRGDEFARPRARGSSSDGRENDGPHLRRQQGLGPLRDHPDRERARALPLRRRQAPLRPGDAPLPRRLPPTGALGAGRARGRGLGRVASAPARAR